MAKATAGTVQFNGETYEVSTSFSFASFYRADHVEGVMIRFHRTEKSAQRGTWDSPEMRKAWRHVGYATVQR